MEENTQMHSRFDFGKIFEYCLLLLVFLTPIVFIPSIFLSLYSVKVAFLATVIVVFLGAFLGNTLSTGKISFPKSKFLIPVALLPLFALISSFFSGSIAKSIAGVVFDLGTSGSLFILSLLFFIAIFASRGEARIGIKSIYALLLSSVVVILHLVLRIFAGSLPESFGVRIPNFLVGGMIDTAIFLGVVVIALLSILNTFALSNRTKYSMYVALAFAVLFIGASGFMPAIVVIGLFSLIYFVYTFAWSVGSSNSATQGSTQKASFPSLFVLVLSVVFILSGGALSGYLSNVFNVNVVEVRPNTLTTINLVGNALSVNPIFGVGPNMFKELWDLNKPIDINLTQFWASEFAFGSAFIPTLFSTVGLLGILSLLFFFGLYLHSGSKAIFSSTPDQRSRFVSTTSFFISLFIWVMAFVYVPSIALLALAFIFTGIFAGTLVTQGIAENMEFNIFKNPRANFASVFVIVVLLISSIAGGYFVWERVVATSMFQKGNSLGAINLTQNDVYWRGVAELSIGRISEIAGRAPSPEQLSEADRGEIQGAISDAILSAREAINWNEKDFQNWFALGRVYEILGSNGIEGSLENAKGAYTEALNRAPNNPAIPLAFARISALENDLEGAKNYVNEALRMKNNYSDAYFTLAQLEVATNNIDGAIRSVESATIVDPLNTGLFFQLGLLKYNRGDFLGASQALERAVLLVPDFANAKYFLGLSYDKLDRDAEAVAIFEAILVSNSESEEVKLILENIKAGRDPFFGATPPASDDLQSRNELPLEE